MSLSRNQEETNYWPSISDMFLVFFVLAMAVASAKVAQVSEGEKYIIEDVVEETKLLVKFTNERLEPKAPIPLPPAFEEAYDPADEEKLASILEQVYSCMRVSYSPSEGNTASINTLEEEYNELRKGDSKRYVDCVVLMSNLLEQDAKAPTDKQLRAINEKVRRGTAGADGDLLTPEQKELLRLSALLDTTKKQLRDSLHENESLNKLIEQLKTDLAELRKLLKETDQINPLMEQIAQLRKQISEKDAEIKGLNEKIEQLEQKLANAQQKDKAFNLMLEQEVAKRLKEFKEANRISKSILDEKDIAFAPGQSIPEIKGKENYRKLIEELKGYLMRPNSNSTYVVEVVGYTDRRSSYELNAKLGLERAWKFIDLVHRDLIKAGINPSLLDKDQLDQRRTGARIKFRGYSAGKTLAKTTSQERHAPSRRLEVLVSPEALRQDPLPSTPAPEAP